MSQPLTLHLSAMISDIKMLRQFPYKPLPLPPISHVSVTGEEIVWLIVRA